METLRKTECRRGTNFPINCESETTGLRKMEGLSKNPPQKTPTKQNKNQPYKKKEKSMTTERYFRVVNPPLNQVRIKVI